jgi:hypothetical protein
MLEKGSKSPSGWEVIMRELSPAGVAVISQVGLEADKRVGFDYDTGVTVLVSGD